MAKEYYDRTAKERNEFTENENIVIRKDKVWVPGKIVRKCSSQGHILSKTTTIGSIEEILYTLNILEMNQVLKVG